MNCKGKENGKDMWGRKGKESANFCLAKKKKKGKKGKKKKKQKKQQGADVKTEEKVEEKVEEEEEEEDEEPAGGDSGKTPVEDFVGWLNDVGVPVTNLTTEYVKTKKKKLWDFFRGIFLL